VPQVQAQPEVLLLLLLPDVADGKLRISRSDQIYRFIFFWKNCNSVRMRDSYKRFVKTWIRFANPWIRIVS
jgi:hypothetical protein